jgi:hypothetical protein
MLRGGWRGDGREVSLRGLLEFNNRMGDSPIESDRFHAGRATTAGGATAAGGATTAEGATAAGGASALV